MCNLRRVLIEEKIVKWAYGCILHCLNKFCKEVVQDCFASAAKEALFVSNAVRAAAIAYNLFNVLTSKWYGRSTLWFFIAKAGGYLSNFCS